METSTIQIRMHHAYGDDALLIYDELRHPIPNALSQLFLVTLFPISFRGFWLNAK